MAVKVGTRGQPAPEYDVYAKSSSPSKIIISGPRSHVEKIKEVSTESVSIAGQKSSVRVFVNLNIKDPTIHTSPIGPVEVNVQIGVRRRTQTVQRVLINLDQKEFVAVPPYISVDLLVPVTIKTPLTAADLDAMIEVYDLDFSHGTARARPDVRFATDVGQDISIKDIRPREVTVRRVG
jgi:YbbR domain-containing protein